MQPLNAVIGFARVKSGADYENVVAPRDGVQLGKLETAVAQWTTDSNRKIFKRFQCKTDSFAIVLCYYIMHLTCCVETQLLRFAPWGMHAERIDRALAIVLASGPRWLDEVSGEVQ